MPVTGALVVAAMTATTNAQVTGLLLTSIADDLDRSVGLVGGLRALSAATALLTAFPLSRVADHYPRKYLIVLGLGLMATAASVAMLAQGLAWFLLYYILAGASDVILFAMLLAAASDYVSGRALDRANGFVIGAFSLPGFIVVPLAGLVSDNFGWRYSYLLSIGLAAGAALLVLAYLPVVAPSTRPPVSTLRHLRALMARPGLTMILLGNLMRFAALTVLIAYTAAYLIERFDLSDGRAGIYFGFGSVVFLLAAMTSGALLARLGLRRVMLQGGLLIAAGLLIAFLPGVPGVLAGLGLLTGALLGVHENGSLGMILRMAPEARGAATSLNEICAALGGIVGSALGGLIIQQTGFGGLGVLLGAVALAAVAFTYLAFELAGRQPARA